MRRRCSGWECHRLPASAFHSCCCRCKGNAPVPSPNTHRAVPGCIWRWLPSLIVRTDSLGWETIRKLSLLVEMVSSHCWIVFPNDRVLVGWARPTKWPAARHYKNDWPRTDSEERNPRSPDPPLLLGLNVFVSHFR